MPETPQPASHDGEREDQPVGADSPQQQRARRLAALSALAAAPGASASSSGASGQPMPGSVLATRQPRWRRARVMLAVVVLLGVAAAAVWKLHPFTSTSTVSRPSVPVQMLPNADGGMYCANDMAFAPQSHRLALLGFEHPCSGAHPQVDSNMVPPPARVSGLFSTGSAGSATASTQAPPGLVSLYDSQRGALLGQFHPSALITPHLPQPSANVLAALATAGIQPDFLDGINYTHLLWSPDGQHLALTFEVFVTAGLPNTSNIPGQSFDGVLLTDVAGANPQVLVHPINRARPAATLWDLRSGTALPVPADLAPPSIFASVPPAQGYTWTSDGALHPQSPFPSVPSASAPSALPLAAVGTPEGGATFTPWQSGEVSNGSQSRPGPDNLIGVSTFAMDTAAWSPDGRFLAQRVGMMGVLVSPQSPAPDAKTLAASPSWAQAPRLPVRDVGLQQAIAVAGTNSFLPLRGVLVAWRPDGKQIAVDADRPDHAVVLFDCATGQPVATLTPPLHRQGSLLQGFTNLLRWSPDGSQLALYDATVATLTIWSGAQLPH
jgi:hypothetical protein